MRSTILDLRVLLMVCVWFWFFVARFWLVSPSGEAGFCTAGSLPTRHTLRSAAYVATKKIRFAAENPRTLIGA